VAPISASSPCCLQVDAALSAQDVEKQLAPSRPEAPASPAKMPPHFTSAGTPSSSDAVAHLESANGNKTPTLSSEVADGSTDGASPAAAAKAPAPAQAPSSDTAQDDVMAGRDDAQLASPAPTSPLPPALAVNSTDTSGQPSPQQGAERGQSEATTSDAPAANANAGAAGAKKKKNGGRKRGGRGKGKGKH
jgi:hypothetical protein